MQELLKQLAVIEQPKFIMLIGLPGSGKSTFAKEMLNKIENCIYLSSDDLREELFNDVNEQRKNQLLFKVMHDRTLQALLQGKNVIYDATNVTSNFRIQLLNKINKKINKLDNNIFKQAVIIATPVEICLVQNNLRDRKVPDSVIIGMLKNFEFPFKYEGWDNIHIHYNQNNIMPLNELWEQLEKIEHKNTNVKSHSWKLFDTLLECKHSYCLLPLILPVVALMHDIGKLYSSDLSHANVSTYLSMFYLPQLTKNEIFSQYISPADFLQHNIQEYLLYIQHHHVYDKTDLDKYKQYLSKSVLYDLYIFHLFNQET